MRENSLGAEAQTGSKTCKNRDDTASKALVRISDGPRVNREQILRNGFFEDLHIPGHDFTAPKEEDLMKMIAFIDEMLAKGNPVGVSCGAGRGRIGTVLACYLVKHGMKAEDAIRRICTLETDEQRNAVRTFRP